MSNAHRFHTEPTWAWAITGADVDAELAQAINRYRQRFHQEPQVLFCSPNTRPQPVAGLHIEPRDFVPAGVFYFATNGREA